MDNTTRGATGNDLGVTKEAQENHVPPAICGYNVNGSHSRDVVSVKITENYGP